MDFPASNNEAEYEAIIAGLDLVVSVSSEKIIIRSNFQLVVGQVNEEYETRDQRMTKYVSLVNLRLGSFIPWRLEHVPRNYNRKADALVVRPEKFQFLEIWQNRNFGYKIVILVKKEKSEIYSLDLE